jgi:hypothetical protein
MDAGSSTESAGWLWHSQSPGLQHQAAKGVRVLLRMALFKKCGFKPRSINHDLVANMERSCRFLSCSRAFFEHECQLMLMISQVRRSPVLVKVFYEARFTPLTAMEEAGIFQLIYRKF